MTINQQQRRDRVLKAVIHYYVSTALPVSSKTLVEKYDFRWSTATVRAIMSDLETEGLLYQPHTSAGRIPTEQGLREYVDRLMERRHLSAAEQGSILKEYQSVGEEMEGLLQVTSKILAHITQYPALILVPRPERLILKHIEFIPLGPTKLLVLLVFYSGLTRTKMLMSHEHWLSSDLQRANNYLNEIAVGLTLREVCHRIAHEMEQARVSSDQLLAKILPLSLAALRSEPATVSMIVEGRERFLQEPEFTDMVKFRYVLQLLEDKSQILQLLDQAMQGPGVKVFIGDQPGGLQDLTLVGAPYEVEDRPLGTLGILGPTRMAYDRVVPLVEYTARLLGQHLSH